ncbi:MAG: hypothetical protein JWN70_1641 [Planctomycetaceae bacterium]|nr:hypothetical protein [Planctomycetaceae bacterium]
MPLSDGDKANFETLRQAFQNGDVALLECQLVSTGALTAVICAVNREASESLAFVPIAQLFAGDPYTLLNPPHPGHPRFAALGDVSSQ